MSSCVNITDTLKDMKYVVKASVDYDNNKVTIKYNAKEVNFFDFVQILKKDGYIIRPQKHQQLNVLTAPNTN